MDIENLKAIAAAATIKGPVGTTGYIIDPARMAKLKQELLVLTPRDYTVFCRDASHSGTTYITCIKQRTLSEAKADAITECAENWMQDEASIVVVGLALGDVTIIEWDDGQ